jgi:RNA polymerase sigma-70 factor, ECF subfamily
MEVRLSNPDSSPLTALAVRAQKGDRKAFEQIVRSTARLVYARIAATVRDRQKAEDLTQDTFIAAWKGIGGFGTGNGAATVRERIKVDGEKAEKGEKNGTGVTGEALLAWLLTVARNTTLDALKAEARHKRGGGHPAGSLGDTGDTAAEEADPAQSAQRAEAISHALSVLEELPEEYRRVLSMRYLAGADYETIRRALDLSDGALRGLLARGMALMRERMGRAAVGRVP